MWLLEQSMASTLVLVCMEINLIPYRQLAKGLFLPYSFLDYVQGHWDDEEPGGGGMVERQHKTCV